MAFKQPRFWKTLERHPLSWEYEDIAGVAWDNFVADLKQFGILDRKITLHDRQVLDGWQLLRACIECDLKPDFQGLPKRVTAEEFVRVKNDNRRHEANELISKRRERVAKARAEGKSLRTIAVEEGVSAPTVLNDLENLPVVNPPLTTDDSKPEEPKKVIGTDGKTYSATKPKILCPSCQHRQRKGTPLIEKCVACENLQKRPKGFIFCEHCVIRKANGKTEVSDCPDCKLLNVEKPKSGKPRFDEKKFEKVYGPLVRIVDERANAMGKGPNFARCLQLLGEFLDAYKTWKKETA